MKVCILILRKQQINISSLSLILENGDVIFLNRTKLTRMGRG